VNHLWQVLFARAGGDHRTISESRVTSHRITGAFGLAGHEFVARGWSRKEIIRLIVCSATYRQSSRFRPELRNQDPNNFLLARQNRLRVEGRVIRDPGLAASGC